MCRMHGCSPTCGCRLGSRDKQAARAGAERFRRALAAHKFVTGNQRIEIPISIGVFALVTVSHSVTVENLLDATDIALFTAKNAGRHCIVVQHWSTPRYRCAANQNAINLKLGFGTLGFEPSQFLPKLSGIPLPQSFMGCLNCLQKRGLQCRTM